MDFSKEILFWNNLIPENSYRPENVEMVIDLFRSGDYCREEVTGYPLLDETIAKAANFPTHTKLEPERTLAMFRFGQSIALRASVYFWVKMFGVWT
jgi:hypothetical protein